MEEVMLSLAGEAGVKAPEEEELPPSPSRTLAGTPTPAIPGRTGRLNYALHETAVRQPVLDKVKEAKKATIDSKPDILGLRGPNWEDTVNLNPGKHHNKFSGQLLSNTYSPDLINSKDVRKLTGTTACRASADAFLLDRTRSPSQEPGGFCTSTALPGKNERQRQLEDLTSTPHPAAHLPSERQRQLEDLTSTCLQATRRRSPSHYVDPVSRQTALSESVRYAKANSGADMVALTAQYGPEGAVAMAAILAMPPKESKPRIRATRADLDAVHALDEWAPAVAAAARDDEESSDPHPGEAVSLSASPVGTLRGDPTALMGL
ncbi:hypothetical protein HYH03_014638 [Edaphochlamys debaryana]|uniref:Uncharacterized protein n=1 Tax=Edaphochlamys debaryana TaxID=47281 RepID=A0A835XTP0_9CHLO|nr:hypothetical protein HYH03_014638 [Edaphochlamys debaryana]|eukprot:KAG2486710.1 hypothetical protein HYH03_014638 [Edaphochlamys debaryana]